MSLDLTRNTPAKFFYSRQWFFIGVFLVDQFSVRQDQIMTATSTFYFLGGTILILGMTGCATMSLWAPDDQEVMSADGNWTYGDVETASVDDATSSGDRMTIWGKIALTPFAVLLDVITAPVQKFLLDPFNIHDKDKKRERRRRNRRDC